jgi:hypothetical protein
MKFSLLLVCVLLLSSIAKSQTYILLDRRWYKPAILVDSVTRTNLSDGWYPVAFVEIEKK